MTVPARHRVRGVLAVAVALAAIVAACTTGSAPATSPVASGTATPPTPSAPATTPPLATAATPSPSATPGATATPSASASPTASAPAASASPTLAAEGLVSGVVLSVDSAGLTDVRGFTLRTAEGEVLAFRIGTLEPGPGTFPAGHLREHLASAAPVEVRYRRDGATLFAIRLRDA